MKYSGIAALKFDLQALVNDLHSSISDAYQPGGTTFSAVTVFPCGKVLVSYVGDSPVYMATRPRDGSGSWVVTMLNKGMLHVPNSSGLEESTGRSVTLLDTGSHYIGFRPIEGPPMALAMTRSIGDTAFDLYGHTHELKHLEFEIPKDSEAILIASSDGVSDARVSYEDNTPLAAESDIASVLNAADSGVACDVLARQIVERAFSIWRTTYLGYMRAVAQWGAPEVPNNAAFAYLRHIILSRSVFAPYRAGYMKGWSSDDISASCIRPCPDLVQTAVVLDGHGQKNGAHIADHCHQQLLSKLPRILDGVVAASSEPAVVSACVPVPLELVLEQPCGVSPQPLVVASTGSGLSSVSVIDSDLPLVTSATDPLVSESGVASTGSGSSFASKSALTSATDPVVSQSVVASTGSGSSSVSNSALSSHLRAPVPKSSGVPLQPPVVASTGSGASSASKSALTSNLKMAGTISAVLAVNALAVVGTAVAVAVGVAGAAVVAALASPVVVAAAAVATVALLASAVFFGVAYCYSKSKAPVKDSTPASTTTPLFNDVCGPGSRSGYGSVNSGSLYPVS